MGPAWRCAKRMSARFIHILTRHAGLAAETSGQGARGARRTRTVFCFPCTIYTWNNRNNKWKSNCPWFVKTCLSIMVWGIIRKSGQCVHTISDILFGF